MKKLRGPYGLELVKGELQEYEDAMSMSATQETKTVEWMHFTSLKLFRPIVSLS